MGYREALFSHNIPFDPGLISLGAFDAEIAHKSIVKWLKNGVNFEALFAGDDEAATGAITAFKHAGLHIPEDIAVVGFDDIYIAQYLSPPLTTINAPTEQVGFKAAQQLLRLIRQEPTEPLVLLPTELIIRRSCGCAWS
ncbi:MAG: hypothetical protein A2Y88_06000 [Chloroflexi bacterium RBG_13_48_10]|nr:MAG: hypothetical protein A2Y88_06000 [Chloroflexi bacterium RBG_13_48_10]